VEVWKAVSLAVERSAILRCIMFHNDFWTTKEFTFSVSV
jgi:hypothetical protein